MADTELAHRVFQALNALEQKLKRRVKLVELGRRVADALQEEEPVAPSVVARWSKGKQVPRTREAWAAFAAALEVDPGWLTYGTGSMTPPASPPMFYGEEPPPARKGAETKPPATRKAASGRKPT